MHRRIEVFADVVCPFSYVGLRRLVAEREARRRPDVALRFRAWPLELVNGAPSAPAGVADRVAALRAGVAPGLFAGFDPERFPSTTLPALALTAAAYEVGPARGEAVALAVRTAVFEEGRDVSRPEVLAEIAAAHGLAAEVDERHHRAVLDDWAEGTTRGVLGSPYFFVDGEGFFCPALEIARGERGLEISFDTEGFDRFLARCFA